VEKEKKGKGERGEKKVGKGAAGYQEKAKHVV